MPRYVQAVLVVATAGLLGLTGWVLFGPQGFVPLRDAWLYSALFLPPVVVFVARTRVEDRTRPAWWLFAAATLGWFIAEIGLAATMDEQQAGAMWTQVLFLVVTGLMYAALVVLIRLVLPVSSRATYLDGLIITLAAAAVLSLMAPELNRTGALALHDLVLAIAYPSVDLLQITLIVAVVAVLRRGTGLAWWLMLGGSALYWVADSYWLFGLAAGKDLSSVPVEMAWPMGMTLMAMAAWTPLRRGETVYDFGWALPVMVTATAFALLLFATMRPVPVLTVLLAAGAMLTGAVRSIDAFRSASARDQAQVLAQTDDLTGLMNRRGLLAVTGDPVDSQHALLLVDIDRFKQINDTLGHHAGDDVLQTLAQRFREVAPPGVAISRIGGDEFALFLPEGTGYSQAMELAMSVHSCAIAPIATTGIELQAELSIGVALSPGHGNTLSALLLSADRALHAAKSEKINTKVFDPATDTGNSGNLLLLQDLRRGLERDELTCHYQPQLDVLTGEVVAVESLVRWLHPQRGVVTAGKFLSMVEQTTLIRPLTDTILDKSLAQLRQWDQQGWPLRMSVNISATNLLDRALPVRVAQLLAMHHIAAERLTLEITETALSFDEERARVVLAQLHEIGVQISIDDYGSGYSSLHQIGALRAQELKLDREFVTGVGERGDLRSILAATVHLAHGLRLRMVAEGVESASDLDQVRLSGCDLAQGFHICPPRSGESLVEWLRGRTDRPSTDQLRS